MTLLELLVAMALLASLGSFIVVLLRDSFDLYHAGEKRGEFGINSMVILAQLEDDLSNVAHGPDGRFLLERKRLSGGDSQPFLRFVRTIPSGDRAHGVLRLAGTKTKPDGDWAGGEPAPESRDSLKPASGMMEVCYALLHEPGDDAGHYTLYRGVHTPVLEPGGFFELSAEVEATYDEAWVRKHLRPVATGILRLDLLCWGPDTTDWDRGTSGARNPLAAFERWDSTRGILDASAFALAVGPASAFDTRDDVYPRRVRAIVTLARTGRPDARLASKLGPSDVTLSVDATDRLPHEGDENQSVNVGGEWVDIVRHDFASKRIAPRPAPASGGTTHPAGTPVWVGRQFERTINLPDPRPSYGSTLR
jgi:hypothetical protein